MLTVAPAQADRGGRVLRDSGPAHSVSAQGLPWAPVFRAGPDPAVYAHTKVHMGRKPRAKRSWCGCIYCAVVRTRDSAPRSPHPLAGGGRTTLRAVCVCACACVHGRQHYPMCKSVYVTQTTLAISGFLTFSNRDLLKTFLSSLL